MPCFCSDSATRGAPHVALPEAQAEQQGLDGAAGAEAEHSIDFYPQGHPQACEGTQAAWTGLARGEMVDE